MIVSAFSGHDGVKLAAEDEIVCGVFDPGCSNTH